MDLSYYKIPPPYSVVMSAVMWQGVMSRESASVTMLKLDTF